MIRVTFGAILVSLLTSGCGGTGSSDPDLWAPSRDLGGLTTPIPELGGEQTLMGPFVTVTYTTLNQGGPYAPRNVGAVWVSTLDGQYVRTMDLWGSLFVTQLYGWVAALPVPLVQAFDELDVADVISGATAPAYGMRTAKWNFTHHQDTQTQVPDGTYVVHIEVTDKDARGEVLTFELPKGPDAQDFQVADREYFVGISVDYP